MSKKRVFITFAILLATAATLLASIFEKGFHGQKNDAEYLRMFKEVVAITKQSYVDPVDNKKLMTGAINGMLAALDPHSTYLPVDNFKEMKVHMAGAFGGVGIELGMEKGKLMVNAP